MKTWCMITSIDKINSQTDTIKKIYIWMMGAGESAANAAPKDEADFSHKSGMISGIRTVFGHISGKRSTDGATSMYRRNLSGS